MVDNQSPVEPTLDTTSHHLIVYKHPGANIIKLRELLQEPCARDILLRCVNLPTFEDVMAQIGADLFLKFDGNYDADFVAGRLVDGLERRKSLILSPAVGMGKC